MPNARPAKKPPRERIDRIALVLAASAIIVLLISAAWAINIQNAPTPSPPTLGPAPTLSPADLTATQASAATASANQRALGLTLAANMRVTPGQVATGISAVGTAPALSSGLDFVAQNVWVGALDGGWVSLYAGALRSDPQQGAVLLMAVLPYRVDQERFVAPLSQGALHITAQNVERLTLVSANTTYYFDVLARRFVSTLTDYAETATPPSPTPTVLTPTVTATLTATASEAATATATTTTTATEAATTGAR